MKQASVYGSAVQLKTWKRLWIYFLIGVPIASTVLVATQFNWVSQIERLSSQIFSKLEARYRYPFPDSLANATSPKARLEQEIGFYQGRVRQQPDAALDQAELAMTYLRMARVTGEGNWYVLADQVAQQSLAKLSFDNPAVLVLARVAEARHDFPGALRLISQLTKPEEILGIQTTSNLAMGQLDRASTAVDALVDTTLSMNAFTLQALVRTAQGKDQEALQSFQQAIAVEEPGDLSNSARTRMLLGRFYYERGQLDPAEALYDEALRILPNNPQTLINLAQLEIRQGHYGKADRLYASATAASKGNPTVYNPLVLRGRARVQILQGDRQGAETLWSEAETLLRQSFDSVNASSFGHRRDLARLLLERGRTEDVAEAVVLMQNEVKLRRDAETLDTYAWALSQAGQLQAAQTVIQEAIDQGIRSAGIFDRAGAIERSLGNTVQANAYTQSAQQVDPKFEDSARQALGLGSGLGSW